jgi:hypothetical protein
MFALQVPPHRVPGGRVCEADAKWPRATASRRARGRTLTQLRQDYSHQPFHLNHSKGSSPLSTIIVRP